jgi:hypothetical protein
MRLCVTAKSDADVRFGPIADVGAGYSITWSARQVLLAEL